MKGVGSRGGFVVNAVTAANLEDIVTRGQVAVIFFRSGGPWGPIFIESVQVIAVFNIL